MASDSALTPRQQRELDYHRGYAAQPEMATAAVAMGIVSPGPRWWWNGYWHLYGLLLRYGVAGKKVLVPGCGFGDDAIRLRSLGAEVWACDLSPDILAVAKQRATHLGIDDFHFDATPIEQMPYANDTFDAVVLVDILHHCDIPTAMVEICRVLKPGGAIFGSELYTHPWLERIRRSRIIDRIVYRRMVKLIYGTERPYITPDEHKIDDAELAIIEHCLSAGRFDWFNLVIGRLVPDGHPWIARADRTLLRNIGPAGRYLASRVIISGVAIK